MMKPLVYVMVFVEFTFLSYFYLKLILKKSSDWIRKFFDFCILNRTE